MECRMVSNGSGLCADKFVDREVCGRGADSSSALVAGRDGEACRAGAVVDRDRWKKPVVLSRKLLLLRTLNEDDEGCTLVVCSTFLSNPGGDQCGGQGKYSAISPATLLFCDSNFALHGSRVGAGRDLSGLEVQLSVSESCCRECKTSAHNRGKLDGIDGSTDGEKRKKQCHDEPTPSLQHFTPTLRHGS
jgi:hypothetical protein